jgi:hypothetical protein
VLETGRKKERSKSAQRDNPLIDVCFAAIAKIWFNESDAVAKEINGGLFSI